MGYRDIKLPEGALYLVTGGAGFIGSCYVRHILKKHPDYKVINIRVDSEDSDEHGKNDHRDRNERKDKTEGTRRSTFPHRIFCKIRNGQIKHLTKARKYLFEVCLKRGHIYIIKPKGLFGNSLNAVVQHLLGNQRNELLFARYYVLEVVGTFF